MSAQMRPHAIVIGGSIAGLLAARVLAEQFEQVTIVDRDRLPFDAVSRRGVPQSVQPHVLFTQGYRILEQRFPGIGHSLAASGAVPFDWGRDFRYFQKGNWSPTSIEPAGLESYTCTRPLLESTIRQQVSKFPNVQFLEAQRVIGLVGDRSRNCITGIQIKPGGKAGSKAGEPERLELQAQLVVDASGRSSQAPQWLQDLGFAAPPATVIDPGLGYATRRYRIPAEHQPAGKVILIGQEPPHQKRLGYLAEVENQEWIATLGGYGQDYPPSDGAGFLEFARTLSNPAFYQAIAAAEPLSETRLHRATVNRLYHYEQIPLPDGFVAIGDAVCALCPVYGQGMTVSAMSSLVLQQWLSQERRPDRALQGARFQKQLARSNQFPWSIATGFDSQFPTTKGAVTPNWAGKLFQAYADRLAARTHDDVDLHLRFIQMAHMIKSPGVLFHPGVILRVLF